MNLVTLFLERAALHPERLALVSESGSLSYAELASRSAALAAALRRNGIREGEVALPLLAVGSPLYVVLLALLRIGAVALFPEPSAGLSGLRAACTSAPPRALLSGWRGHILRALLPELRRIPFVMSPDSPLGGNTTTESYLEVPADAPALITFSSGSTGRPKGVLRSHGFLLEQQRAVSALLQPQEGDVDLISLPVFVLSNLASGVSSVLPCGNLRHPARLDAKSLIAQIERHGVNRLVLPPSICARLAQSGRRLEGIRRVFTGGGPVFPDLLHKLSRLAPRAKIVAVYGSSEAEPIAHAAYEDINRGDFDTMANGGGLLAGKPVDNVNLRIVDDEIWVAGAHVVQRYLDPRDDAGVKILREGRIWHRTGDAGRLDQEGRLWLLGRHEAGCNSLYPFQVEPVLRGVSGVSNAAFLYVGGKPVVAVECESGTVLPDRLMQQWRGRLQIVRVSCIPIDRRHQSKIDYTRLRTLLSSRRLLGRDIAPWTSIARECKSSVTNR